MYKFIIMLAVAITLTGCGLTPKGNAARAFGVKIVDTVSDQNALNALSYLCKHARVGSIQKLFPHDSDQAAYAVICKSHL